MKYHFKLEKEEKGFSASCLELEGCRSEGDTREELKANLEEALNLYLDEPAGSNLVFTFPETDIEESEEIMAVAVDPQIAFAMLLRQFRLSQKKSQVEMQKLMGFKTLNSYSRLEKKNNPTLKVIERVLKVYPDFPLHQCFG